MVLTIFMLVIILLLLVFRRKNKIIKWKYEGDEGFFLAKGHKEKFKIKVDNRFEFLVENGVIVACRDKKRFRRFIYYKGD